MHAAPWKSGPLGPRKFDKFTRALAPVGISIGILLFLFVVSCSHPSTDASAKGSDPATRLQLIPAADPQQYGTRTASKNWKNPYLIVREDGIGLLDLANNEIHILKPEEVSAALAALPPSAWPYGRVVAVREGETSRLQEATKIQLRKNRALLAGTLEEMKVAINWLPQS